jgi:hypothetical protein
MSIKRNRHPFTRRQGRYGYTGRPEVLHVETEGAIVNIRIGLYDQGGRPVTSVEILADPSWELDGHVSNRIIGPRQGV